MSIRWQHVNGIYQIYPRSFSDTNGDGIGDLAGITKKLDYIKGTPDSLGIDAIWISPFYTSPMADFGYDVSNYCNVDPIFGNLDDFNVLIAEAHQRSIKVMIDYVPNHTSDEHPWFEASRSSREDAKRDWYVWRDPKTDGTPPNNWLSVFGGSAWEYDDKTGQYYLHSFLAKQPDLNWANPEVRKAMTDVLRFWLELGVDGIRADAVRWIAKDAEFRDNPLDPLYQEGEDSYHAQIQRYSRQGTELVNYLKEIAATIENYPDRIILFEDYIDTHLDQTEQYMSLYSVNPAVAAPFNFEGMGLRYDGSEFRTFIDRFEKFLGGKLRPFYCFSNHDKPRLASRVGPEQAKLIGLLQLTLPGIPVIYYGDELGMANGTIPPEKVQDPFEKQQPGKGLGRDPGRTPMQWSSEQYAGFSTSEPWLPTTGTESTLNVASELIDPVSHLSLYRNLLRLRQHPILRTGQYIPWSSPENPDVFGYIRRSETESILIVLNMSKLPSGPIENMVGEVLYSTHPSIDATTNEKMTLMPHQGLIIRANV
jgi:alpha-glucosidase